MEKKKGSLASYKEACDFIYEATIKPDGYHGSFTRISRLHALVAIEFVKRGIIKMEGNKAAPVYIWAAIGQHPTNCLYSSVAESIRKQSREAQAKSYQRKKELTHVKIPKVNAPELSEILTGPAPENNPFMEPKPNQLRLIPDAELWAELKARGYEAVDGRLAKFLN